MPVQGILLAFRSLRKQLSRAKRVGKNVLLQVSSLWGHYLAPSVHSGIVLCAALPNSPRRYHSEASHTLYLKIIVREVQTSSYKINKS